MTAKPLPTAKPLRSDAPLGPVASVFVSAALLGCIGGVFGSIILFGVLHTALIRGLDVAPVWLYFTPRDVLESSAMALFVVVGYRNWPSMRREMTAKNGVLKVAAIVGCITMFVERTLVYKVSLKADSATLLALIVYVAFIALPVVWTVVQRAPDAPRSAGTRLSDREFFKTSVGLFLTVAALFTMHWLFYADTIFAFFGVFFLPATAIVLAVGFRHLIGGVAKALEWSTPDRAWTIAAVGIFWAATFYYFFYAHSPHRS